MSLYATACTLIFIALTVLPMDRGNAQGHEPGQDRRTRSVPVSPALQQAIDTDAEASFIVRFTAKADLSLFNAQGSNRAPARTAQIQALRHTATVSQASAESVLQGVATSRRIQLWSINALAVTANASVIEQLRVLPEVESITIDATLSEPTVQTSDATPVEWNLDAIGAPALWAQGYTGSGIVVSGMDTGVDYLHADLAPRWRGGSNSWFDPHGVYSTPHDASGHGTGTISLAVGGDATGTAIGVAPGAQWIAVKIFSDIGQALQSQIHQGFQWLLDPDGDPATDDAPHIVNNSWGYANRLNQCYEEFKTDIDILKSADISVVFSAGNRGAVNPSSQSPANNEKGYAVGAVDIALNVAPFSARGPSACDQAQYPQVVAPGVNVKAAFKTFNAVFPTSFTLFTGTSAAAPHVAGAIALLRDAFPEASVEELEEALEQTATDYAPDGADYVSGYGLIDVLAAAGQLETIYPIPSNEDPDALDDAYTIEQGSSGHLFAILANDSDPDGDALTIFGNVGSTSNARIGNDRTSVVYTPKPAFVGTDTFEYSVSDGAAISTATVTVTVDSATDLDNQPDEDFVLASAPGISSPLPGSTLSGSTESMSWSVGGESVDEWWVYAGSAPESNHYYNSGRLFSATNTMLTGIPTDGSTVYVTLYYRQSGGSWQSVVETYTAATIADELPAVSSPTAGVQLSLPGELFSWTANSGQVDQWWLYAGPVAGSNGYYDSGNLMTATSAMVNGYPADGSTVYVTLYYRQTGRSWQSVVVSYTAPLAGI